MKKEIFERGDIVKISGSSYDFILGHMLEYVPTRKGFKWNGLAKYLYETTIGSRVCIRKEYINYDKKLPDYLASMKFTIRTYNISSIYECEKIDDELFEI